MVIKVTFVDGKEESYDADSAVLDGPVSVLYKRVGGRLQSGKTFRATSVAVAEVPNGNIVLGAGKVQSS
jgi:hypothetical protein